MKRKLADLAFVVIWLAGCIAIGWMAAQGF
jgi:hypothetical protein